jgi:recombination protein RecR
MLLAIGSKNLKMLRMIDEIPSLNLLVKQLQAVPYLASKNLYRVVDYFLRLDALKIEHFCHILLRLKNQIAYCELCCMIKEREQACLFCHSVRRNQQIICVVETWQDVVAIERTKGYNGIYHVLGGSICPLEGVGPEDLSIDLLKQRVNETIIELILATNQTPEGEATAAFLANQLQDKTVKISCLSRGLPVGASIEAMDKLTLCKALSERRLF